jgi:secreted trypsin-like serine protease
MTRGFMGITFGNFDRNYVEQRFRALTKAWVQLSMVNTKGQPGGGTCYGDSGGPHFITQNGVDVVVSVTVTGDAPCVALDTTYRTDTPVARSFLGEFVTLP